MERGDRQKEKEISEDNLGARLGLPRGSFVPVGGARLMQLDRNALRRRVEETHVLDQDRRPRPVSVGRCLNADASAKIEALSTKAWKRNGRRFTIDIVSTGTKKKLHMIFEGCCS